MLGQLVRVIAQAVGVEMLDRHHDLGVEIAPPVVKQTRVGHVVGQSVLECVLKVREKPCLVEELGSLEMGQALSETFLGQLRNGWKQRERYVLADDGGDLQETFILQGEPVDARRQHHLDGGRDLDRMDRLRQPIAVLAAPPAPSSPPAFGRSPLGRRGFRPSARSAVV